jgi:1,4-alpha-glucan branching enzyme
MGHVACVFNLTPVPRYNYRIGLPDSGPYRELLNTDGSAYGGSNMGNGGMVYCDPIPWHGFSFSASITLPPLAALVLVPEKEG